MLPPGDVQPPERMHAKTSVINIGMLGRWLETVLL
jgi:hypothetical protein